MTKDYILKIAVIPGVLALAVIALSAVLPFTADGLAGYGTVLFLAGIAALEYRFSWKRFFSR